MRKVLFDGYWFNVCKNETELKREILKKYGVIHFHQELHHIFGRTGILKLMPDNVVPINRYYHAMQKAMKVSDRYVFDNMVEVKIDKYMYKRLSKLAQHIKNKNVLFGK